jgi:hypothetical protein
MCVYIGTAGLHAGSLGFESLHFECQSFLEVFQTSQKSM